MEDATKKLLVEAICLRDQVRRTATQLIAENPGTEAALTAIAEAFDRDVLEFIREVAPCQ